MTQPSADPLEAIHSKLDRVLVIAEVYKKELPMFDERLIGFDRRLTKVEQLQGATAKTAKDLASAALWLTGVRVLTFVAPAPAVGALVAVGAVLGGAAAQIGMHWMGLH